MEIDAAAVTAESPKVVPGGVEKLPAAFDAAYDDLFRVAYRVSYRIVGSRTEAEDITQEALVRAYLRWRKIHTYSEAWVSRVASNLAIDAWRRRRRADLRVAPDDESPTRHDRIADRVDLLRLLDALPRRQREVLVVRYLADQTEKATAAALGCSVGSVKRHSHRALNALRARIDETESKR